MSPAFLGAVLALSLCGIRSAAAAAPLDHQWVVLDPILHRQGDKLSIRREGPWVRFTQRWSRVGTDAPDTDAIVEQMAVNCLTGAYGQTRYPSTDAQSNERIEMLQSFDEIEHAQDFDARLLLEDNSTALGRALMDFSCTCRTDAVEQKPSQGDVQSIYDRYVVGQLAKTEYHLKFLRVKTERIAKDAIAELAAGKSFETVFDAYASPSDATLFPHGDLGHHLETEYPIEELRRYRALEVGQVSPVPHPGLYGWEVVKLASRRTVPAPSLNVVQPRIQAYLIRANRCGWSR